MKLLQNIRKYTQIEWLMFLCIIAYMAPWFIWGYNLSAPLQYGSALLLLLVFIFKKRMNAKKGIAIFLLLIFYFVLIQVFNSVHLSYIFISFAYLMALNVTQNEGRNVMNMLTSYIFLSVVIPLPLWLIHQYITPLPLLGTLDISSMKGGGETIMENYFFFVSYKDYEAMRFYSWFDEPGVLGTFAPFVLYANRFNFKDWRIPVILIGCLFTFSMAYYILTLVAWLWHSRKSIKSLAITLIAVAVIGYGLYNILADNLAFQQAVVTRALDYDERGVDSRNNYETEMLWKQNISSGKLITGLGSGAMDNYGGIASSYKSFIIEFGYIGCILLFIAYFSLLRNRKAESFFALFLFALSFLQRPQLFTVGWFFIFTCVIAMITEEKSHENPIAFIKNK